MTIHEVITLLAILCPMFYAFGRVDSQAGTDGTEGLLFVVGVLGVLSLVVAITLRVVG